VGVLLDITGVSDAEIKNGLLNTLSLNKKIAVKIITKNRTINGRINLNFLLLFTGFTSTPHLLQNFLPGMRSSPQEKHLLTSEIAFPQPAQNSAPYLIFHYKISI